MKPIVYLGLSGGVDSAVAAALLLEAGYDVRGVFLKIWSDDLEDAGYCPWVEDRRDAIAIASQLNIPIQTLDFQQEYKKEVFCYFLKEYQAGRTPNPDILCNQVIKFGSFLKWAQEQGGDYIATGHHVRRSPQSGNDPKTTYKLLAGIDENKDQSYFLSTLDQDQLRHSLFPIGNLTKDEVREKAKELGMQVAEKPSTKGICFVGDVSLRKFLPKYANQKQGDIKTKEGRVIGIHEGVGVYTIGQRKGLNIPATSSETKPYFVIEKNAETNELIVSNDERDLLASGLLCSDVHWISGGIPTDRFTVRARIRYNQSLQDCEVELLSDQTLSVTFKEQQRAITPGQVIVFYDADVVLGSGIIN